jgi:hypothetical protein
MKQAALNKVLHDTLKQSANEHNWKYSRGFAFKATDLLFFSLIVVAQAKQLQLSCSLRYKLLAFDDLFWKIVGLEENSKQPLSFRAFGAWTAPDESLSDITLSVANWEPTNLRSQVNDLLIGAESDAANVTKEVSNIDDNLRMIETLFTRLKSNYPDAVTDIGVQRVLTSILKHDYERAEAIILDRRNAHDSGGFQVGSKSFYDLAHEYLGALS